MRFLLVHREVYRESLGRQWRWGQLLRAMGLQLLAPGVTDGEDDGIRREIDRGARICILSQRFGRRRGLLGVAAAMAAVGLQWRSEGKGVVCDQVDLRDRARGS